ncbi:MAG: GGDEF domain-containing phosphodiesterase [Pseudomonadota bacterium]
MHTHGLVQLSGLSAITESLGQESTRLYLSEFAERLQRVIRPTDKLLKVSTDKYCVVLNGVASRRHVELALAKLERELAAPAEIVGESVFFHTHVGFVLPSENGLKSKELLRRAETALRKAVEADEPAVIVSATEVAVSDVDAALLPRIERALQEGEFTLYYQAKVDAVYEHVVGAEGLVRWLDTADNKVITPNAFIDAVEESALIEPLTHHLLKLGLTRCQTWSEQIGLALNIAPPLLEHTKIVDVLGDAMDVHRIQPQRVTLEITERGELKGKALQTLSALQALGVTVSIDDFGTGRCSLSYFRDLPADQIKIDQTFVQAMDTSRRDLAIVRSCIEMAHGCGMKVVAEGVEDAQTAEQLRKLDCDYLQGYYFGKPLSAAEFELHHLDGLMTHQATPDFAAQVLRKN